MSAFGGAVSRRHESLLHNRLKEKEEVVLEFNRKSCCNSIESLSEFYDSCS